MNYLNVQTQIIPARFNGPSKTGNGGYVSGLLALRLRAACDAQTVTATLRKPPPLNTELTWRDAARTATLLDSAGDEIGNAAVGEFRADPPGCPDLASAHEATRAYEGHLKHPFATCFTCGTTRGEGDGLRVFSGPLGNDRVAAVWTPHPNFDDGTGHLDVPTVWAAMDCPGGWAVNYIRCPVLLGQMTATIHRVPQIGEEYIIVGEQTEVVGRKHYAKTAIYRADDGELLARAEQLWISITLADFE